MSDKWDWQVELGKAHLIDKDIAEFLKLIRRHSARCERR